MRFRIVMPAVIAALAFSGVASTGAPPLRPSAQSGATAEQRATPVPSAADKLFAKADFDGALAAYMAAVTANPSDVDANIGVARISLYHDDLDTAEAHARAVLGMDPQNRRARSYLATIAERRGDGQDYRTEFKADEVDIAFVRMDPLPVLRARVNGHMARLLLDTGGSGLDLTASFAKSIGLVTKSGGEGVFAGGRTADVRIARVESLELGAAIVRGIPVSVVRGLPDVDGVLGTGILYRFLATIDYPGKRLVLRAKEATGTFEAAAAARNDAIVPMLLVPDHFIFAPAHIAAGADGLYNIDTGGGGIGVQLTKASLAAAGITPDPAKATSFRGGGGEARVLPFTADVTLGTKTVKATPGTYFPDGDQYGIFPFAVAGTISHEFLKHGTVTFDFAAMKLVFDTP